MDIYLFKQIFDQSSIACSIQKIFRSDDNQPSDYKLVYANKAFELMTGFNFKDMENVWMSEFINLKPDWNDFDWFGVFLKGVENGKPDTFEAKITFLNKWFHVDFTPLDNDHFLLLTYEISHFYQKDEEKEQETNYRRFLFENTRDGIVVLNSDHKVIDFNSQFQKMIGYQTEDLLKMRTWDFDALATEEMIRKNFSFTAGINVLFESKHRRADGSIYDVEVNAVSHSLNENRVVFCSCRDISERKKSEKLFKDEESKMMAVSQSAQDGIIMMDHLGKINFWNPAAERIFGYVSSEVIGKNLHNLLAPEEYHNDFNNAFENFRKFGKGNAVGKTVELVGYKKDKVKVPIELSLSALKSDNQWHAMAIVRDISERKAAENLILQNETNMRAILENSFESIWAIDENYEILFINNTFEREFFTVFGIHLQKGTNILSTLPDSIRKQWKNRYDRIINGESVAFEDRIEIGNTKVYIEVTGNPLMLNNEIIGAGFVGSNITEKKMSQLHLQESQRKYQIIADNNYHWEFWEGPDHQYIYHSPSVERVTGYSDKELISNPEILLSIIHPDDLQQFLEHHQEYVIKHKKGYQYFRIIDRHGQLKYIEHICQPVYDNEGNFLGIRGTNIDITDRKIAEEKLRQSTKESVYLRDLSIQMANLPDFSLEISSVICESIKAYTQADVAIFSMFDKSKNAFEFKHLSTDSLFREKLISLGGERMLNIKVPMTSDYADLIKANPIKFSESMSEISNGVVDSFMEKLYRSIAGNYKIFSIAHMIGDVFYGSTVLIFNQKDAVISMDFLESFANLIAITLRRNEAESDLQKAKEKAVESDRLKSAFLQNMSHEIRTPMNGILGFINLLSTPELTDNEKEEYIDVVNKSGQRLLNTINDIVEVSKIEAGVIELHYSNVKLSKVMDYHYNFFKMLAKEKDLTLIYNSAIDDPNFEFVTDKHRLDGIMTNLLYNALKFTEKGEIEFGNYLQNDKIVFFVKDTGIGIAEAKQQLIFERFIQVELDVARTYEGSGLGLTICKAYVDALEGEIWVKSKEGEGSVFYFSLPVNTALKSYNEAASDELRIRKVDGDSRSRTLLIVEDELINYTLLVKILRNLNLEFLHVKNGQEAVEMVKNRSDIDLILMDIKMPVLDGLDATKRIREFDKKIPIIAQTAHALSGEKEKALEAGCNDYISKPILRNVLIDKISKQLFNN